MHVVFFFHAPAAPEISTLSLHALLRSQQELIELAQRSEMDAEDSEMRRDYARSIQYLRASERNYNEVTGEFPGLRRQANVGSRSIQIRLIQLKKALVDNAQLLSGSGFSFDAKQLASGVGDTSREAMISTLKADYRQIGRASCRERV